MLYTEIIQIYIYYNNCIKIQRIQIRWENYLSDCVVINIFYEVFFIIRCKTLMQQQDLKCVPVSTWPFPHASPLETLHSSGELKDTHAHAQTHAHAHTQRRSCTTRPSTLTAVIHGRRDIFSEKWQAPHRRHHRRAFDRRVAVPFGVIANFSPLFKARLGTRQVSVFFILQKCDLTFGSARQTSRGKKKQTQMREMTFHIIFFSVLSPVSRSLLIPRSFLIQNVWRVYISWALFRFSG